MPLKDLPTARSSNLTVTLRLGRVDTFFSFDSVSPEASAASATARATSSVPRAAARSCSRGASGADRRPLRGEAAARQRQPQCWRQGGCDTPLRRDRTSARATTWRGAARASVRGAQTRPLTPAPASGSSTHVESGHTHKHSRMAVTGTRTGAAAPLS